MTFTQSTFHNPIEIFDNSVLAWGLVACGLAQTSKLFVELLQHRRWRPSVLVETGGMPSSHSALVTATAAGIGWELGFSHPAFALASTIAFVVMYDASGVRQEAGLIAARINKLPNNLWGDLKQDSLKENLGHTRLEVLIGSLIGPTIALPGIVYIGSPLHLMQLINLISG